MKTATNRAHAPEKRQIGRFEPDPGQGRDGSLGDLTAVPQLDGWQKRSQDWDVVEFAGALDANEHCFHSGNVEPACLL